MRIYLNKLKVGVVRANKRIDGFVVSEHDAVPYVAVSDDFDINLEQSFLERYFIKATIHASPMYEVSRKLGTYHFGKATAELTKTRNASYALKIETMDWSGIPDMKILQERLWAGTISPDASYDKEQSSRIIGRIRAFISKRRKDAWCKEIFALQKRMLSPGFRQK